MPTRLDLIEAQAMQLSVEERADLAERLWMSVTELDGHDAAWDAEIARRVAEDDAGRSRFMSAEVAMDRLGAHIRRRLSERQG